MQTLSDIWRLLLDCYEDIAGLVVKPFVRVVVTNIFNRVTDNFLIVKMRLCCVNMSMKGA